MATSAKCFSSLALLLVVAMTYVATGAFAATYVVGDSQQWTIVPSSPTAYTDWASRQRFVVGDSLVFNFATGAHDVLQVSSADYEACNIQSPVAAYRTGPATVNLTSSGAQYFICGVGVHCSQFRQRMSLTVSAASSTPATPSPPPATGGPTASTTPPATTATPPATSSTPTVPSSPGPSSPATPAGTPPRSSAAPSNGHGKSAIAAVALAASVAALVL